MREQGRGVVPIAVPLDRLHAAGWSVGLAAFTSVDGSGRVVWRVDGRNGENLILAAGATAAGAWAGAEARGLGITVRVRRR